MKLVGYELVEAYKGMEIDSIAYFVTLPYFRISSEIFESNYRGADDICDIFKVSRKNKETFVVSNGKSTEPDITIKDLYYRTHQVEEFIFGTDLKKLKAEYYKETIKVFDSFERLSEKILKIKKDFDENDILKKEFIANPELYI